MKPGLILADEPTGNLDQKNGEDILTLLSVLNKEEKITVVMVTHDQQAAQVADQNHRCKRWISCGRRK